MSMIIHQLQQGTEAWHKFRAEHFTASDASAMLGYSKYKTRTELLQEKKTGITPEVTPAQQALFDKGHLTEAMARAILEERMADEFFPVTGTSSKRTEIAASLDGMTFCESILFEHKLWNLKLAQFMTELDDLPDTHWPQVEQQLYVSGAGTCVFVVSDGTEDNWVQVEYYSRPERLKKVLNGWSQFEKDLESYEPKTPVEKVVAEVVRELPAITFDLDKNSLALTSNIKQYKEAALALVKRSKEVMKTDQDFADAEARSKIFKSAETKLESIIESVQGEVQDIDTFVKDVREIKENIRQSRLSQDKQVKARKEEVKAKIVADSGIAFVNHVKELNKDISPASIPFTLERTYFSDAIKGKKNVSSIQSAADDALAKAKIEANEWSEKIADNLTIFNEQASAYEFLFADKAEVVLKDADDLSAVIKARIAEHQEMLLQQEEQKHRDQVKAEQEVTELASQQANPAQEQVATNQDAAPVAMQDPIFKSSELKRYVDMNDRRDPIGEYFSQKDFQALASDGDVEYELELVVRRVAIKNQKAA